VNEREIRADAHETRDRHRNVMLGIGTACTNCVRL